MSDVSRYCEQCEHYAKERDEWKAHAERLRDALEDAIEFIPEFCSTKRFNEALDATPEANLRAIEARGMRMASDIKRGMVGTAASAGYWAAFRQQILEAAAAHEKGE